MQYIELHRLRHSATCSVEGCDRDVCARGWCSMHYKRWAKHGDPLISNRTGYRDPVGRFWSHVEKTKTCWLWDGTPANDFGHGKIWVDGRFVGAHVFSYWLMVGPVADGLQVLHTCDVPNCVRPDHLYVGTQADNMADKMRRGRQNQVAGEKHGGSKLTEEKVREIRRGYALGRSQSSLSREFGIARTTVQAVVERRSWSHLPMLVEEKSPRAVKRAVMDLSDEERSRRREHGRAMIIHAQRGRGESEVMPSYAVP
jgi:hypothetical protein